MTSSPWRRSWRADPVAAAIADRHYSRKTIGSGQFTPPGRVLVLRSADQTAVWATLWPFAEYVLHDWAGAWMNTLFRKEGSGLASDMIRHAIAHTRAEWPDVPHLGMVTMIDASKVRHKRDPGRCYRKAGFRHVGFTQSGLYVLQMLPREMPPAELVPGGQPSLFEGAAS
jgi:hypothetical protein